MMSSVTATAKKKTTKSKKSKSQKSQASSRFSVGRTAVSARDVWPVRDLTTGNVVLYAHTRSLARLFQKALALEFSA